MGNLRKNALEEIWTRHCAKLDLDFRGECPLNRLEQRDDLKRHADAVAGQFQGAGEAEPERTRNPSMDTGSR
jgi:hypothetical protein